MEKIVCIYHKNCTDGTTSAAVLLKKFPDCKLFPMGHGYKEEELNKLLEEVDENTVVYISDFSLRPEDLKKLLNKAKKVINIDHHIGVKDTLEEIAIEYPNFEFIFDNNSSGASLTWKYFYGEPVPQLIKYVEDKDIWKWEFKEDTKYVDSYLMMLTDKPEEIKKLIESDISNIKEKGRLISQFIDYLINKFVENANPTYLKIDNYIVKAFNTGLFQSEIGNILSTRYNEPVALFSINGDFVKISFRSNDDQNLTALQLAKALGGGGHKNAAGASVSIVEFCNMIVQGGN
jgi:oligoribonuclease NrnB/cAMP/cGMP phosphodiesterase (DHH superfamily)